MSETIGGLLDDAWRGWSNFWEPKEVPAGAGYDAAGLGQARAASIGQLGGSLLALGQAGVSPETRARILAGIGDVPLTYQQSLLASGQGRLQAAQTRKLETEDASQRAFGTMVDDLIQSRQAGAGGRPGGATPGNVTPGNSPARLALAALKGPESGGNPSVVNSSGYSGLFQIGTGLASSAGLYKPAQDEAVTDDKGHAVNSWRGQWVIPGFEPMTHQQWLQNPAAQEKAGEIAMNHNWSAIQQAGLDKYVGQTIGGVQITPQALLQGAWMGGVKGLEKWLTGQGDPADSNKATVSRWAGLTTPGTMTDAGAPAMVPTSQGGPGGPAAAPGGGRSSKGDLTQLTNQQLLLLKQMTPAERSQWLLQQSNKTQPTPLTTQEKQSWGLEPGAVYVWDENGKPSKLQDARASDLSPAEKVQLGYPSDAVVQRKPDGTYFVAKEGQFKRLGPEELQREGHRPDAIVERGPDGKTNVLFQGRDPNAPLNEGEARSTLAELGQRVKEGKVDPNSPEGRRYRAAYDLLEKGRWVDQEMKDGTTRQIFVRQPVDAPRLGDAPSPTEGVTTKQPAPLTEFQAKTKFHVGIMTAADRRMDAVMKKGWKEGQTYDVMVNKAPETVANWLRTPQGQLYTQAQVDWTLAKLRWESGALIGEDEARKEYVRYFPQPFDSPEVVAQKNEARKNAQAEMRGITGQPAPEGGTTPASNTGATPLPEGQTQRSVVEGLRSRITAGKATKEEAAKILQKYGIHESWLD